MSIEQAWVAAEVTWGLAAFGTAAVSWSIWSRAARETGTVWLCGGLVALTAHYGLLASDAFLHASGAAVGSVTAWGLLGRTALTIAGTMVLLFLRALLLTLYTPPAVDRWVMNGLMTLGALGIAVDLSAGLRLAWHASHGAPPESLPGFAGMAATANHTADVFGFVGPMAYCAALFERVPAAQRLGWSAWLTSGGPWQWITAPSASEARTTDVVRMYRTRVLAATFTAALLLLSHWSRWVGAPWTVMTIGATVVGHLALAPLILGLTYCHAKPVFFDVVLKRGLLTVILALVSASSISTVWTLAGTESHVHVGVVAIGLTLLVCLAPQVYDRGSDYLDRALFGRPDYPTTLRDLSDALARCAHPGALMATVTDRLSTIFAGATVRHAAEPSDAHHVTLTLGDARAGRGYLTVGPRAHGQPYASEDLTFLDAVAAQVAGRLEALSAAEAQALATAAELRALRAQINPHFLFNALTTIAEMTHAQPAAERAILNLSRVFHYALDSSTHDRLPLRAELDAIRAYLELEAERFGDRIRVVVDVPPDLMDTPIPPMLLQPLVENAVRHGLAGRDVGGTLQIRATKDDGQVRLTIEDDGVGFDPATAQPRVGLANVQARVDRLGGWCRVETGRGRGTAVTLGVVTA